MMYDEFLKMANVSENTCSYDEYTNCIEVVYTYHPYFDGKNPKEKLVEMYKCHMIDELLPRAMRIRDLEKELTAKRREFNNVVDKYENTLSDLEKQLKNAKGI